MTNRFINIPANQLTGSVDDAMTPDERKYVIDMVDIAELCDVYEYFQSEYTVDLSAEIIRILDRYTGDGDALVLFEKIGCTAPVDSDEPVTCPSIFVTERFIEYSSNAEYLLLLFQLIIKKTYTPDDLTHLTQLIIRHLDSSSILTLWGLLPIKTLQLCLLCVRKCRQGDILRIATEMPQDILAAPSIRRQLRERCPFQQLNQLDVLIPIGPLPLYPTNRLANTDPSMFLDKWDQLFPFSAVERQFVLTTAPIGQFVIFFVLFQRYAYDIPEEIQIVFGRIAASNIQSLYTRVFTFIHAPTAAQTLHVIEVAPHKDLVVLYTMIVQKFDIHGPLRALTARIIERSSVEQLIDICKLAAHHDALSVTLCQRVLGRIKPQDVLLFIKTIPVRFANVYEIRTEAIRTCLPADSGELATYLAQIYRDRFTPVVRRLTLVDFADSNIVPTPLEREYALNNMLPEELGILIHYLSNPTFAEYMILLRRVATNVLFTLITQIPNPSAEMRKIALERADQNAAQIFATFKNPTAEELELLINKALSNRSIQNTPLSKTMHLSYLWERATREFLQVSMFNPDLYKLADYSGLPITLNSTCYDPILAESYTVATLRPEDNIYIFILGTVPYCVTRDDIQTIFTDVDSWFYTCIPSTDPTNQRLVPPPTSSTLNLEARHPDFSTYTPYCAFLNYHVPVLSLFSILQQDEQHITPTDEHDFGTERTTTLARLRREFEVSLNTLKDMGDFDTITADAAWMGDFNGIYNTFVTQLAVDAKTATLAKLSGDITTKLQTVFNDPQLITPSTLVDLRTTLKLPADATVESIVQKLEPQLPSYMAYFIESSNTDTRTAIEDIQKLYYTRREIELKAPHGFLSTQQNSILDKLMHLHNQRTWANSLATYKNCKRRVFMIKQTAQIYEQVVDQIQYTPRADYISRNHCNGDSRILSEILRVPSALLV